MGRDKHEKNRKTKWPPHVRLYKSLLNSSAWLSLSPVGRALYVQLAARYMGSNNGRIPYSVRDGQDELHVGKSTVQRALAELVERGFLVAEKRGAFSLKLKHATEWRLTDHPCDLTGRPATKDYMKWSPEIQNAIPVVGPKVPVAGPIGTYGGTSVAKRQRNSTCAGTENAENSSRRYLRWDTFNIPGRCGSSAISFPHSQSLAVSPQLIASLRRKNARADRTFHTALTSECVRILTAKRCQ